MQNGMLDGHMASNLENAAGVFGEDGHRKRSFADFDSGSGLGQLHQALSSRAIAPSHYSSSSQFLQNPHQNTNQINQPPSHSQFLQQSPPLASRPMSADNQGSRGLRLSSSDLQSQQQFPQQQWAITPEISRLQAMPTDNALQNTGDAGVATRSAVDASLVDQYVSNDIWYLTSADTRRYYQCIHQHLPMLPHNSQILLARAESCPAPLRDAFYEALHTAARAVSSPDPSNYEPQKSPKALLLIFDPELANASAYDQSAKLVHLQTLILMSIEAMCLSSNTLASSHTIFHPSVWITNAVNLAYRLKLHMVKPVQNASFPNEHDTEVNVSRRTWMSLCVIERWHAHGTGTPSMIPENSMAFFEDDKDVLGGPLYWLSREHSLLYNNTVF